MDYLDYTNQTQQQPQKPQPQKFGQQKDQLTKEDFKFGDLRKSEKPNSQQADLNSSQTDKDELLQLFAIPVLICKCTIDYSREEKWCRNYDCDKVNGIYDKSGNQKNHHNRQSKDTFILDNPELKGIRAFIQEKLDAYTNQIYNFTQKLIITQSWLNKSNNGEYHHHHRHPNSIISGVWYPAINSKLPPIQFARNDQREFGMKVRKDGWNFFNSHNFQTRMNKGELILFPSNLTHNVPTNTSNEERISLSFNTWPKGDMGDIDSLTYLPFDRCV